MSDDVEIAADFAVKIPLLGSSNVKYLNLLIRTPKQRVALASSIVDNRYVSEHASPVTPPCQGYYWQS
ncbi:MAG: hypothetical protein OXE78_09105 [Gammaproteobacteria bacterium]|nr:hypothetical protein [Gammaproteobacteria bacterium]MCY4356099.1 hypothetical protein [Gammaproteobacteria bacterium]